MSVHGYNQSPRNLHIKSPTYVIGNGKLEIFRQRLLCCIYLPSKSNMFVFNTHSLLDIKTIMTVIIQGDWLTKYKLSTYTSNLSFWDSSKK